jgi:hypothetical protein
MMAIAIVLDQSALVTHAQGHVAVGELISEVEDEGRLVAVPAACLTAAGAAVSESDTFGAGQLARLTAAAAVAVLPLAVDNALEVSEYARVARGDIATGHAVFVALEHEAYVATARPTVARSVLPAGWGVIDVSP